MTFSQRPSRKTLMPAASLLATLLIAAATSAARADVAISVQLAPPPLVVYDQPPMPAAGYIWTPGYWAWDPAAGYYWVPGTWVAPPVVGVLWTPPYWGWSDGVYLFHAGYWGPHVGFYGGIDYGFGYGGRGYDGGHWDHGHFAYNRAANNFGSVHVTNVYNRNVTVVNRTHVSYVGGAGGVRARPTAAEMRAAHETHRAVTAEQTRHFEAAQHDPAFAAKTNNGHPAIAATARPAAFEGAGVTHERAAPGPHAARANQMQHPQRERSAPQAHSNMAQHPQPGQRPQSAAPHAVTHASPGPRPPAQREPVERARIQPSGPRQGPQAMPHGAAPRSMPQQHMAAPQRHEPAAEEKEKKQQ